jgi:hypothetical protein
MVTITGDHVGYPGFQDSGNGEKFWGEQKFARLSASNFAIKSSFLFYSLHR